MSRKLAQNSKGSRILLPFELIRNFVSYIIYCLIHRPVFSMFVCSSITVIYLILSSPKVQQKLASLPYEEIIAQFKSRRMITVYATVAELFMELLMAVVLAGVSIIITMWLVFEEVADRRHNSDPEGKRLTHERRSMISTREKRSTSRIRTQPSKHNLNLIN